jgi:hypothetical protein
MLHTLRNFCLPPASLFWLGFLLLALQGCNPSSISIPEYVQVAFVYASPGGPNIDIYVNNEVKEPGFAYGFQSGSSTSPYFFLTKDEEDIWTLSAKKAGTSQELVAASPGWEKDKRYTVAFYDTVPNQKILVVEDDNTKPSAGKARIRFVHLVANHTDSLALMLNATPIGTKVAYGAASGYVDVDAGSYILNAVGNTTQPLVQNTEGGYAIALRSQRVYTLLGRGLTGPQYPNPKAFTVSIIANN